MKVASYNIHKGIGLDRRRDPDRILHVLDEVGADVVALQEADRRFFSRRAVITPERLEASGWRHVPFHMKPESLGWHGNAILVRDGIGVRHAEPLWLEGLEPRGAVLAELDTALGPFRVVGMHLDLSGLYRVRQVLRLVEVIDVRSPLPTIIMGDTNDWNRGRLAAMDRVPSHFRSAPCGPSFHTRRPVLALDRILYDRDLELVNCGVHRTALSRRASDHLPIWAELKLA
ncbi:endonuclease [Pacificimonas flava]|uniref:Endonuclease n=2 Tax=Pacificimonas TaxID=1960290 RepID=A0A219B0G9_9SPHN|nr:MULTISPECIES: endonuclease/exonuclease/phosphatase family protein [Pacificimonas]MBZ6379721.1 endonuclease/exonuclease/phosphatase family protein [Pacificimonas aurantium]OWV31821.1 endonuclease [Pacificimonas flava]